MDIIEEEVKTKICQKCGRTLPLGEFAKNKTKKDGLANWCKACTKAYNMEYYTDYYAKNKEKVAARHAEYYANNKDKRKAYMKAYTDPILSPLGWAKRMVGGYRAMDRQRGFDDSQTITADWFVQNIAYKPCKYCGKQGIGLIGCNRLDNTKPHTIDNVVPCCPSCNSRENIRDMIERGLVSKRKKQSFKEFVNEHKAKHKNLT